MSKAISKAKENIGQAAVEEQRESVLWEWTKTIIYAILLALFIRTFFLQTFRIPTGSMEPTLLGAMNHKHGDKIIVIKFIYGIRIPFTDTKILQFSEPERGDVVVFGTKGIEGLDQKKDFIKRVVGMGGETIEIVPENPRWDPEARELVRNGGHIYINGERLMEPEIIANRTYYPTGDYGIGEVKIPEEHYYVLGDNAENSKDSRYWGFVPEQNVIGKAVAIYWPPSRIGLIE
ncbi:MAG: signal peptidase I [Candidatus Abyssubacteria bacterium]